ncbi:MAG TPA: trehalose-phosphatase [Steroidobacteraceae bacterium]|nr:trehalose-phosphatase [Steroidobacteraceae bacterium]
MSLRGSFLPQANIALFLDVDGTLLEIAATPWSVRVPAALRNTLQLASRREDGALALISGRTITELDRLFAPLVLPAAGQHGVEIRDSQGSVSMPDIDAGHLDPAREVVRELIRHYKGLLLEDKGTSLAVHFRQAPQYERAVMEVMGELAHQLRERFVLRDGKCVTELTPRGFSKRGAIEAFMRQPPFVGRIPLFIGDDVTDEDGFEAVNALGGYSVRVGDLAATAAKFRFSSVSTVVAWLRERNLNRPAKTEPRRRR